MTVKLALLKSGEDVIADWHEIVGQDDNVIAYLAKRPYTIKINQTDVPSDDEPTSIGLSYFPWMPLSKDTDIPIDLDWGEDLEDPEGGQGEGEGEEEMEVEEGEGEEKDEEMEGEQQGGE